MAKVSDLGNSVNERLASPASSASIPIGVAARRTRVADKWLLSSAVQKLIRRGQSERAVKAALQLHHIDPGYLPRRLPIIALEDVGIADLILCFDVLHALGVQGFRSAAKGSEQRRVLANLVSRLALSIKSRSACDIFCLAHADRVASIAAAKFFRSSERGLVEIATDRRASLTSRALSLHLLSGMSVEEGRWHRSVSRFNGGAVSEVAKRLELPEIITCLMVEGRNTDGLAAMLPLVLEAVADGTELRIKYSEVRQGLSRERPILGLPAFSVDMYTRVGKKAIAEFSRTILERHPHLFAAVPDVRQHAKIMEMAIFHAEGSKLDRWLENKTLAEYRERIEQAELRALGLPDPASRLQLYRILEAEGQLLWQIRQSHLRAALGKDRRAT